ncbi:MAG: hypothetical protein BGO31_02635 [Bacteroidetes bacterium 43-16]|nr:MAG: hypothetical protein BGO31_02635 [Bacteroidetes bacterium 43-16]
MNTNNKDTAFSEDQFNSVFPENINKHYWNRARNYIIKSYFQQFNFPQPCIEIGCGRGSVIAYLAKHHIHIQGVDIADTKAYPEVAAQIKTNTDALLLDDAFTHQFKSLLLFDVLEHIEDPDAFLNAIFKKYPNVEQILLTVPARMEIWSNFDEYLNHFRRYDLNMIESTANATGCRILARQYAFHSLYPFARALKAMRKERNTEMNPPKSLISNLFHKVVATYFRAEYKLFPKKWKGTTVIAVLQRK